MKIILGYSKSQIKNATPQMESSLISKFSYINTSVDYELKQHIKNRDNFIRRLQNPLPNSKMKPRSEKQAILLWYKQKERLEEARQKFCVKKDPSSPDTLWFPTGLNFQVLSYLKSKFSDIPYEVEDIRVKPAWCPPHNFNGNPPDLRPYQKEIIETCISLHQGTVEAATGSGKTLMFQEIIRRLGLRSLILVPNLSILEQTVERFQDYFGRGKVDSFSGKRKKFKDITIACIDSVALSENGAWDDFDVLCLDECFPGKTKILTENGEKTIKWVVENRYSGNVASLSSSGDLEWQRVYDWFENKTKKQIRQLKLTSHNYGMQIFATHNHKFRLLDGSERSCGELRCGDILRVYPNLGGRKNYHNSLGYCQESVVRGTLLGDSSIANKYSRLAFNHGNKQKEYAEYKASILNASQRVAKSGYTRKEIIGFQTKTQLDYKIIANELYIDGKKTITRNYLDKLNEISWAFWWMDDGNLNSRQDGGTLHTESFSSSEVDTIVEYFRNNGIECKKSKITKKGHYTINFPKEGVYQLCNRIVSYIHPSMRYKLPEEFRNKDFFELKPDNRDYALAQVKTNTIKTISSKWDKQEYSRVYNISVKKNHNYFANGFNVSNCHHAPCETLETVLYEKVPNAYYRFGFTATKFRTDGTDLAIDAACGPTIYDYPIKRAIEEGYLAKPIFGMFKITESSNVYGGKDYNKIYKNHILRNWFLNKKAVEMANNLISKGKSVLILVKEKSHGHLLGKQIAGSVFVRTKEDKKDIRKLREDEGITDLMPVVPTSKAVQDFNNGLLKCLIGTSVIGEGTDIIPVDALILLNGGVSKVSVIQNVGRGLRKPPGKDKVLILDFFYDGVHETLKNHSAMRKSYYEEIADVAIFD